MSGNNAGEPKDDGRAQFSLNDGQRQVHLRPSSNSVAHNPCVYWLSGEVILPVQRLGRDPNKGTLLPSRNMYNPTRKRIIIRQEVKVPEEMQSKLMPVWKRLFHEKEDLNDG